MTTVFNYKYPLGLNQYQLQVFNICLSSLSCNGLIRCCRWPLLML